MFLWYLWFSWRDLSSFPFSCFPLLLCIDCWGRLSYLSLLFFGTLHSDGYIFPFNLCFLLLFGNPLQCSCLENPMDGGAWWATVHGLAKSRTRLSDFTSLLFFSQLFVRPPQTASLLFCISFSWRWCWSLSPVQCHEPPSIVHQALLSMRSNPSQQSCFKS